jgi:hypothetical protein
MITLYTANQWITFHDSISRSVWRIVVSFIALDPGHSLSLLFYIIAWIHPPPPTYVIWAVKQIENDFFFIPQILSWLPIRTRSVRQTSYFVVLQNN